MSHNVSREYQDRRLKTDRRVYSYNGYYPERRSGVDRRSGQDRRANCSEGSIEHDRRQMSYG